VAEPVTGRYHGRPMPSLLHEALIELFRNRPSLAPEVLRDALGVTIPSYTRAVVNPGELTQVVPTEYRADLVVLLNRSKPVLAIVVEVQLERDPDKRWTWPAYLATLRERLRCPATLLVVTLKSSVATWCSQPIAVGPGWPPLVPCVLGPQAVPVVTDEATARKAPELAVLSAEAHGRGTQGLAVALAALGATVGLDESKALFYTDLVLAALSAAARKALEEMLREGYQYQSDFAKKYFGAGLAEGEAKGKAEGEAKGKAEGEAKGKAEGEAKGKAEGEAKGKAEGEAKGKAESLLTILSVRGISMPENIRQRALVCQDLEQLDAWLRKAVTAESLDEVFE
jgi:hypothetical protein